MIPSKVYKYGKNLATYFGASLIPMALNLIINPWVAKNMDPTDYAISGYYTSFSTLISPIIIFYLIHFYIKEYFRRDEEQRKMLYALIAKATIWFSGIVSVLCLIALYIYLKYFTVDFSFPIMPYLALMVFALPLTGLLNLQLAQYRMEKNATTYCKLSVSNGILNVICTLVFVVALKWGAFGKLLGPLVCNIIVFIIMVFKFKDYLKLKTKVRDFFIVFKFCLPLALSAMLGYFTHGFSTTYLESVGNVTEYGYYVVGASIGSYLTVFGTAIGNTFQPDLYETTIKRQWKRYAKFCFLQIGLISLIVFIFIFVAPYVIYILTAGRYIESTEYAQIIALSTIASSIYFLVNNYSIATNRPKLYLYTSIIGSGLIVGLMPLVVDKWSFVGGSWMSVLSFIGFALINISLLQATKLKNLIRLFIR